MSALLALWLLAAPPASAADASSGTAKIAWGGMTKRAGAKHKEGIKDCGDKALCKVKQTAVTGVALPVGVVLDAPVLVGKGLFYGVKAVGRGIAYPFRKKKTAPAALAAAEDVCSDPPAFQRAGAPRSPLEQSFKLGWNGLDALWHDSEEWKEVPRKTPAKPFDEALAVLSGKSLVRALLVLPRETLKKRPPLSAEDFRKLLRDARHIRPARETLKSYAAKAAAEAEASMDKARCAVR